MRERQWTFIVFVALLLSGLSGCSCDTDEHVSEDLILTLPDDDTGNADDADDDADDSTDDTVDDTSDDTADDSADDDTAWESPTAWEDFLAAEDQVRFSNFSTAMTYYDSCIDKLLDANPLNDGPVEELTMERAEYGYVLMLTTLVLRIIESVASGALGSSDIVTMMRTAVEDAGLDADELPTSLLTVYLRDIILPKMELGIERIDHARSNPDFTYPMPPIRFVLFNHAVEIPARTADGRGEHDLAEAHLVAALYHLTYSSALFVTAYNLDTDAARIDDLISIIFSGDVSAIFQLLEDYPNLLTLHDDAVIDGRDYMARSHEEYIKAISATFDDEDQDGYLFTDDGGTPFLPFDDAVDPAEQANDFYDAWNLETDAQADDIVGRSRRGTMSLNIKIDGGEVAEGGLVGIVNLIIAVVPETAVRFFFQSLFGYLPAETDMSNGKDDELALGVSTAVSDATLTDAGASFTPDALVGALLNPNTAQADEYDSLKFFKILANTATTITVEGGLSAVADAGDEYSVGDGFADDGTADFSFVFNLLMPDFIPAGSTVGMYISPIYDDPPSLRDFIPAWDEGAGDPDFLNFVVDRTETYNDVNGNGAYDIGIDTFTDQDHVFGSAVFPADGFFEPYYFFFGDGTMGGLLQYGGDLSGQGPNDCLNRIISGLLLLGGAR